MSLKIKSVHIEDKATRGLNQEITAGNNLVLLMWIPYHFVGSASGIRNSKRPAESQMTRCGLQNTRGLSVWRHTCLHTVWCKCKQAFTQMTRDSFYGYILMGINATAHMYRSPTQSSMFGKVFDFWIYYIFVQPSVNLKWIWCTLSRLCTLHVL